MPNTESRETSRSRRLTELRYAAFAPLMLCLAACAGTDPEPEAEELHLGSLAAPLTAAERLAACRQDPRVLTNLVSAEICAGASIFFNETFGGNGRTCSSCHPVANNFTVDRNFIASLPPGDPLFVFEQVPALATLETRHLRENAGIRENVDGFEDLANKFVVRSVPHVMSLATSIKRDSGDLTTNPPIERVGWSGDGPGNGSLREFTTAAVIQHFPTNLTRVPGQAFRLPSPQELDLTREFQLNLGRKNELNLAQVNLFDAGASDGKAAFIDPQRGRCNECHANAGANSLVTGLNRNFDSGNGRAPIFGNEVFDGGFGGQGLTQPNLDLFNRGVLDSFGNGTFSTPPLIEAADTSPFFHTNAFTGMEAAVSFYNGPQFRASKAGRDLETKFGTPIQFSDADLSNIARFLRTLNAAFNLDIAKQRLRAAATLVARFQNQQLEIQRGLIRLAQEEIDDAITDMTDAAVVPTLYPVAQDRLALAKQEIAAALSANQAVQRASRISNAISRVENARDQFGANITFSLGQGNLMF